MANTKNENYSKKESSTETWLIKWIITIIAIFVLVVGIALVFWSISISDVFWKDVLRTIGLIAITLAATSLWVDRFVYIRSVKKGLAEILTENDALSVLTIERVRSLNLQAYQRLYLNNDACDEAKNLIQVIDGGISKIMCDYYFSSYTINVHVSQVKNKADKPCYEKTIQRTIDAKPMRNDANRCLFDQILLQARTDNSKDDYITVEYLKINGELLMADKDYIITEEDVAAHENSNYKKIVRLIITNASKLVIGSSLSIDFKCKTTVDASDKVFSLGLSKPCQKLVGNISKDSSLGKIYLDWHNLLPHSDNKNDKVTITCAEGNKMIMFKSWVLTGEGFTAYFHDQ